MAIENQGGFSFTNGNNQLTRKVHWMIETHTTPVGNKLRVTFYYADVTTTFTDGGGTTWYPYQAGAGTYADMAQTKAQFDGWVQSAGANVNSWSTVQSPYYPEGS